MKRISPPVFATLLVLLVSGCEQVDQTLPFEPDEELVVSRTIPPAGGLISHPSGLSLRFLSGTFTTPTPITVLVGRADEAFPGNPEGQLIAGTYFTIVPADLTLRRPVEVDLVLPVDEIGTSEIVRIGLATGTTDAGLEAEGVNFDLTAGLLRGRIRALGAIAAVISDNGVGVGTSSPTPLLGGVFDLPGSSASSAPAGGDLTTNSANASSTANTFTVVCSHRGVVRRCLRSRTLALWASTEIQDRLPGEMVVLNPNVQASLELTDFVGGLPTRAKGTLSVTGTLRAKVGQTVTSFEVDETFSTNGPGGFSPVTFSGNTMTLPNTTLGSKTIEYEVSPSGTGQQLIVRGDKSVDFDNEDGTTTTARIFIDLRLRR